ncbi:hypothetical protein [Paracoccus sp. (in: a-proteobacteria)]|uniref:hypothetical protein n=1 Tax=Paracoccus sp. TaxID=267 RepID=UPI00321FB1F1
MKAALRLESFATSHPDAAALALSAALDEAYRRGHAEGLRDGRDDGREALVQALERLCGDLEAAEINAIGQRQAVLAAVAPILAQIVDALAPTAAVERLCQALTHELAQLARQVPARSLTISCQPALRPEIEACLARAGLAGVRLQEVAPGQAMAELNCGRTRIRFDPAGIVAEMKSILASITAEEHAWTT